MRRRNLLGSVLLVIACFNLLNSTLWAYSGGTGEPNDPYQIATAEDLIALGQEPNDYNDCFILTADIDLSGYSFGNAVIAPDINEAKREFQGTVFGGTFDGQGYAIVNLVVDSNSVYAGLFGLIGEGGQIHNLHLSVGSVRGKVVVEGTIRRCGSGALAGKNQGLIRNCLSNLEVRGIDKVGGLVGENRGTIVGSISTGEIGGEDRVGGLVGYNSGGTIMSSYSTGSVSGNEYVGGLVGDNRGNITSSYSTGNISGEERVGGFVGENYGSITSSYSTGSVSGDEKLGGLVGYNLGSITSSFWDTQTSSRAESDGGTGLTTAEMQDINTFLEADWDLVGETANGTCDYWMEQEGDYPCLVFFAGGFLVEPLGCGTDGDPYLISDANDLGTIWYRPNACYRLDVDIDLEGITWKCAVVPGFCGMFDGNGHVIRNLQIEGGGCLGLFGICTSGADISYIGLESVEINGTGRYIGGLMGMNRGNITSSYSRGSISGNDYVGGLMGTNQYSGCITSSYSTGSVSGDYSIGGLVGYILGGSITSSYNASRVSGNDYVGGLAGFNYEGSVTSSYSTGSVSGYSCIGGLVGTNQYGSSITSSYSTGSVSGDYSIGGLVGYILGGSIMSSYSAGSVSGNEYVGGLVGNISDGSITSSVWDMEASECAGSDGGIGLTTAEMMDAEMLGLNGFASDPNWILDSGQDYPRLAWEQTVGEVISEPVIDWLSGSGTQADPYQIESVSQLLLLSKAGHLMDQCFDLTVSLDLIGLTWSQAVLPYFNGRFNGNDKTINNLTIEGQTHLGFFGILGPKAEIRNLGLESVEIDSTGGLVGGLAGYNHSGSITSSYSNGNISGTGVYVGYLGGLVGYNREGDITFSSSSGNVTGTGACVGGLVGCNSDSSITLSYSTGSVRGNRSVGGLVGSSSGNIMSSYSTGSVRGNRSVGGLVGSSSSNITSSYSIDHVDGDQYIGGFVGYVSSGSITSSYSTGSVSGNKYVGGLVGVNDFGNITSSYSIDHVDGDQYVGGFVGCVFNGSITSSYSAGSVSGNQYAGGLVGWNYYGSIRSSIWDTETSGQDFSEGGTGQTTAEMQDINTYLDAGWDFVDETDNGTDDLWWMPEGDYPRLWWEDSE